MNDRSNNKRTSKARTSKKRSNNHVPNNRRGNKVATKDYDLKNNPADINDASYYFTNPEVMKQLTNVSFNQFAGVPFEIDTPDASNRTHGSISLPTMLNIKLNPSAGSVDVETQNNINNGVNMAARQLFLKLSAGNMKSTEYGPEDVILAVLGIGNMLESLSFIRRFFGIVDMYNPRNRAVPQKLISIQGLDPDDFVSNLADYRARFNYIIDLANKIPFFSNFAYFHKCATLYDNVYVDSTDNPLSPLYIFTPFSRWTFDDLYSEKGAGLRTAIWPEPNGNALFKMSDFLDDVEEQVLALVNSTALLKVYSDVLRLIDKENYSRLVIAPVPSDYGIVPVYSDEVKWMVRNCTIVGAPMLLTNLPTDDVWLEDYHPTNNNDVVGNTPAGAVDYYPAFHSLTKASTTSLGTILYESILTLPDQNYSTEQFVESTRFVTHAADWWVSEDPEAPFAAYTTHVSLPDHYVVKMLVDSPYPNSVTGRNDGLIDVSTIIIKTANRTVPMLAQISKYDCAPFVYLFEGDTQVDSVMDIIGDFKWYTTIDYKLTRRINDFAMLGLLTLR